MTELPEDPRVREALGHAMRRLAQRDHLTTELVEDLARRGFAEPEVAQVIEFLSQRRLVNDERTMANLVERRSGRRAAGRERIRAELVRLGAPEAKIEEQLAKISDDDEREAMRHALSSRKWKATDRGKAARFLLSRGFSEDLLESALDDFFDAE